MVRRKSRDIQGKAKDFIKQLLSYPSTEELTQKQSRNRQKPIFILFYFIHDELSPRQSHLRQCFSCL